MFSSSLLTIASVALQLRTLLKPPPLESPATFPRVPTAPQGGKFPRTFSSVKGRQSVAPPKPIDDMKRRLDARVVERETLASISAALSQSCGRYVLVRSARKLALQSPAVSNWAYQGRALMHGSHDLSGAYLRETRNSAA